ncbi:MAG: ankyrin repeat domain-containing protein [Candidatus Micrarchaeia archaeon]
MEKVLLVGVGGAGCNMVNRFARSGLQGEFAAVDSDARHLSLLRGKIRRINIGRRLLHGTGCAGNAELGEKCAKGDEKALANLIGKASNVVLCVGLGGGLGTGAAPFLADIAKKRGALVLSVAYYPFRLEKARQERARKGLERLQRNCNAVILLDNNRLARLMPNLPMSEAFVAVDKMTAKTLGGLFECAGSQAPEGRSWIRLCSLLGGKPLCTLAWGSGKGKEGAQIAAKDALKQSFADDGLADAHSSVVMLCCGNGVPANSAMRAISAMRKRMGDAEFCIVPRPKLVSDRIEICGIAVGVRAPIHGAQEELNRALIEVAASGDAAKAGKLFKKGADARWKEADGTTALHKAANLEIARLLIGGGADAGAKDNLGAQPIHGAAFKGKREVVRLLVENGADVNAKGPGGATPLHFAAKAVKMKNAGHAGLVRYLIRKGADVNARNSMGHSPLFFAGDDTVAELLGKAGAKRQ